MGPTIGYMEVGSGHLFFGFSAPLAMPFAIQIIVYANILNIEYSSFLKN